jgi:hypothetical protein
MSEALTKVLNADCKLTSQEYSQAESDLASYILSSRGRARVFGAASGTQGSGNYITVMGLSAQVPRMMPQFGSGTTSQSGKVFDLQAYLKGSK